ncbi:hypothetical protein OA249_03110 [Litorivicinus sp.]|nr:hypothetical protein [Litorivicinus sp.]
MHRGKSRVFSAEGGGWEFPLLLVASFIAGGLGGAGKYAIDNPEWMKHFNFTQSTATQAIA